MEFFQEQFRAAEVQNWPDMMENIPRLISQEDNATMIMDPTEEEVTNAVHNTNGDNVSGPNGFSGLFYQHWWTIIDRDVTSVVQAFFCGQILPRFVTHTNLVLLPKNEHVKEFVD